MQPTVAVCLSSRVGGGGSPCVCCCYVGVEGHVRRSAGLKSLKAS